MALVDAAGRRLAAGDPPWLRRCPVWLRLLFTPVSPTFGFWLRGAIRDHEPDVLHLHLPNVSAFWALLLPSAWRLPWVVHWHSDVEPSRFKPLLRLAYPFYAIFERALLDRASVVIPTSAEYLEASVPLGAVREKCRVVPLGLDPARLPDVEAGSGDEALVMAANNKPDCVTMDVNMPGMSGFETAQLMLARDPDIRIVMLTANIQESSRQVAASLRLNFVAKPVTESSLTLALDFLLATS